MPVSSDGMRAWVQYEYITCMVRSGWLPPPPLRPSRPTQGGSSDTHGLSEAPLHLSRSPASVCLLCKGTKLSSASCTSNCCYLLFFSTVAGNHPHRFLFGSPCLPARSSPAQLRIGSSEACQQNLHQIACSVSNIMPQPKTR